MNDAALYLEVDEDITSAIDKLSKTAGKTVQIVVPKRSTMLQSVINLKLLKKAAAESGKELVLVTNDRIATDLAARVGLAVATALGGKAVLSAAAAAAPVSNEDIIEEDDPLPPPPVVAPVAKPVPPAKKPLFARHDVADHTEAHAADEAGAGALADVAAGSAAAKTGPKVPNFNHLKRRLIWLGTAVVLIAGYFVMMSFFETAKVTLFAAATKVNIDATFVVDPQLSSSDLSTSTLTGQNVTFTKDLSTPFTPTGKKDAGTKAAGTMTVINSNNKSYDFVTGTRFQAPDGKIFRTTADVHIEPGSATIVGFPPQAVIIPSKKDVSVAADANGDSYNEAPATYSIPGLPAAEQQGISGSGKQMSGGTSKNVTVVTQADIDAAKTAALAKDKDAGTKSIEGSVPAGFQALVGSLAQTADGLAPSPAVDQEGSTGTLAFKVTYTELAVKKSEYLALIKAAEQKQIGDANQIYDDGLATAQVVPTETNATRETFHFTTEAFGGAKLDIAKITAQIKGKKYGDANDILTKLPGIQRTEMNLWPAWAFKLPGSATQIKITIQVAANKG